MRIEEIVDFKIENGRLFHHYEDDDMVVAHIPTICAANHASNLIELNNGDIICTWFAGSEEGSNDIKIYMSRLKKGETKWGEPVRLSDDYTRSEQNPQLFQACDGKLWLFHTAQDSRGCSKKEWETRRENNEATGEFIMQHTAFIRYCISEDNGYTWGPKRVLFEKPGAFCRQRMIVMSNGEWLMPIWYSVLDSEQLQWGSDYSVVKISTDEGETWEEYPIPNSKSRVHANVMEMEPGRLTAFLRSRSADRIYVSYSQDYGRTWTEPARTILPNNNSSIQAIKLAGGNIAMIFNNVSAGDDPDRTMWPGERRPVTVAISEDGGETWPYMRDVETGENFCGEKNRDCNSRFEYPSILQSTDGYIHISYSFSNRKCIKYLRVSEEWVRGLKK